MKQKANSIKVAIALAGLDISPELVEYDRPDGSPEISLNYFVNQKDFYFVNGWGRGAFDDWCIGFFDGDKERMFRFAVSFDSTLAQTFVHFIRDPLLFFIRANDSRYMVHSLLYSHIDEFWSILSRILLYVDYKVLPLGEFAGAARQRGIPEEEFREAVLRLWKNTEAAKRIL